MTIPHPHTALHPAVNIWSTATHQFAAWYDLAGELRLGRIERDVQRWGVSHTEYTFGGTPRTTLALPVQDDEHAYPSIMVDGNGRIHVWANMHNQAMRYVRSVDPHTSNTWTTNSGWVDAASELPGVDTRCTYPTPIQFADGSFAFYLRNGHGGAVSGQYNSYMWDRTATGTAWTNRRLVWQGLSVADAGGPGVPGGDENTAETDATNWSPYPTNFLVESARDLHPGRLHVCWCWRSGGFDGQSNVLPSYAYSDDKGATWRAIDGTALTVPMTPLNNHACRIPIGSAFLRSIARAGNIVVAELDTTNHGFIAGDSISVYNNVASFAGTFTVGSVGIPNPTSVAWGQSGVNESGSTGSVCKFRWFNWGSIAVDPAGLPHIIVSVSPSQYIHRNASNTGWVIEQISNGGATGVTYQTRWGGVFWRRGHLWGLVNTWVTTSTDAIARVRLVNITAGNPRPTVLLSGDVGDEAWDPTYDHEAWRRFGWVETFAPDGSKAGHFQFGRGHRRRVA